MSRTLRERLKTVCIIALVIAGILQVGILWSYQNQGTPISFLSGLFRQTPRISHAVARERLFFPDRLVLSDGGNSFWTVPVSSENYSVLWNEAINGLKKIAAGEVRLTAVNDGWGEASEKRGYIVDLGFTMEPELLGWFLGTGGPVAELPDIRKVMVKRDITDDTLSTFHIYSGNGTVYSSGSVRYDAAIDFDEVISEAAGGYRKYSTFRSSKIQKAEDEPDVLYAIAPKYWPYHEISAKLPAIASNEENLAAGILGAEKDRYNKYRVSDNTIQFTYGSNIYRYYEDGCLTYRYLGNVDTAAKKSVGEALLNAYKFIAGIYDIDEAEADIVLTSVDAISGGIYRFGFDYKLDGMPVNVNIEPKDGDSNKSGHAISIQADGRRVLECDWLLREFERSTKRNYNETFTDLLNNSAIAFGNIGIRDIHTGYSLDTSSEKLLIPSLLMQIKGQDEIKVIEMIPEEGD